MPTAEARITRLASLGFSGGRASPLGHSTSSRHWPAWIESPAVILHRSFPEHRPLRILVVDDERSMRELLAIVLRAEARERWGSTAAQRLSVAATIV